MKEIIKSQLKSEGKYKISFFGDSITSAEWVHPNWREIVEYTLKENIGSELEDPSVASWGIRGLNAGFDGATTKDLKVLLNNEVLDYKPNLVILMATSNDLFADISPSQHKQNIKEIIDSLLESGIKVVYSTDIPTSNSEYNQRYKSYVDSVSSLFPYKDVQFINMFEEYQKFSLDKFFTFECPGNEIVGIKSGEIDYIHPNQLGNAYIAKVLLSKIFKIDFDPELYIDEHTKGVMFPSF